jgi:hypothetical protein
MGGYDSSSAPQREKVRKKGLKPYCSCPCWQYHEWSEGKGDESRINIQPSKNRRNVYGVSFSNSWKENVSVYFLFPNKQGVLSPRKHPVLLLTIT